VDRERSRGPSYGGPKVRTRPSASQSVSLRNPPSEVEKPRVFPGCSRLGRRRGRQGFAERVNIAPTRGNVSGGPYSSPHFPLMCSWCAKQGRGSSGLSSALAPDLRSARHSQHWDRGFESVSLHRRVSKPSVPQCAVIAFRSRYSEIAGANFSFSSCLVRQGASSALHAGGHNTFNCQRHLISRSTPRIPQLGRRANGGMLSRRRDREFCFRLFDHKANSTSRS
jgi:hypothetical protein